MTTTRRLVLAGGFSAALGLTAGRDLLSGVAEAAGDLAAHVLGPPVADRPIERISPHVFLIRAPDGFPTRENQGMMSNITFVVGDSGVVVVDSGASLQIARMAVGRLKDMTAKPVVGIVNTHYHGDHWLGNHGFVEAWGEDLPRWSHRDTRIAIEGETGSFWRDSMVKWTSGATMGTRIVAPNHDVGHGFEISLGDVTLRLHHYGRAHTPCDLCVEVVEDGVTCVGDVLMDHRIANLDDGSYKGTFDTLDHLQAATKTTVWLPAHGAPGAAVLAWQRDLFEGIWESCVRAVERGVPLDGALAFALKDPRVASQAATTAGWDRNIGKYVSIAYLEAEQAQF
ncbi:MAG: MBL fold metallo-hydrolase [Hyphomicrobiales bacterium]|nr:MBL fold metallo-hydrolase [Hyphomicrobiales bacterium]